MMNGLPPYAEVLGIHLDRDADGRALLVMPFGKHLYGRPGFIHGGPIAGLLEIAAFVTLHEALGTDSLPRIKPINVTVDFMRGGRDRETRAIGRIIRLGKRIANVSAEAWQDDPAQPIATARMNLMLVRD